MLNAPILRSLFHLSVCPSVRNAHELCENRGLCAECNCATRGPDMSPLWKYIHCVPKKTCDHVFDDKLKWNCPFTKIFGILITKSIGHRQVFLFAHLTYLVQLLYLGKLSRRKYQQKLNKIMKISQKDVILVKNLYLSMQYGARRLLSKLPDKGWKLGSIDSLFAELKPQDGYNCPASRQR